MFSETAEYYDLLYTGIKDYVAEARALASRLRKLNADCRTILDVACGTGTHARLLATHGFAVDGLDIDPALVRLARQKHPGGRFFEADMTDFHLPHRYDAILSLFSSIGYAKTLDRVRATLACCREHLSTGGVLLVEPWFPPGVLDPGRMSENVGEGEGVRVVRRARVELDERISRLLFSYEITDSTGTHSVSETHELGLFTSTELSAEFEHAGLTAKYDPVGLAGRGLFTARVAAIA